MKKIKLTAVLLLTAVLIFSVSSCKPDRSGYMTNNCTKDGVAELLKENPELKENGFTKKTTYNVTPDDFNGISLFKSSETGYTVALYPGYSYTYVDISGTPGLISAVLCDADGNGITDDILFTYADDATDTYGIGCYSGILGYSTSVFRGDGELRLYLSRQQAGENMPDVYSVLAVTVTEFRGNPADLGCVAVGNVGVVTCGGGVPVFSPDSGAKVTVSELKYTDISRIIISTADKNAKYTDEEDITKITDFLKSVNTGEDTADPVSGVTYIIALVYRDGSVSYAYYNDAGTFKLHGGAWRRITSSQAFPFPS